MEKLDTLRYLLGSDVDAVIAPEKQILAALDKYYPEVDENTGSQNKDVDIDSAEMIIESSDEKSGMEDRRSVKRRRILIFSMA